MIVIEMDMGKFFAGLIGTLTTGNSNIQEDALVVGRHSGGLQVFSPPLGCTAL